jgi:hypothetical protein
MRHGTSAGRCAFWPPATYREQPAAPDRNGSPDGAADDRDDDARALGGTEVADVNERD